MRTYILPLCLAICLSSLWGCGAKQSADHGYFHSLGLSAHPSESAEAIVARANNLEQEAMILAAIGYATGKGGFPLDADISYAWVRMLQDTGAYDEARLLTVCFQPAGSLDAEARAEARLGQNSPLARKLQRASLFDVEAVLAATPEPGTEEKNVAMKSLRSQVRSLSFRIGIQDADPQAPDAKVKALFNQRSKRVPTTLGSVDAVLFLRATKGQKIPATPLWLGDDMRVFFAENRKRPQFFWEQMPEAQVFFLQHIVGVRPLSDATLLARAHQGEAVAIRLVASSYLGGVPGFPHAPPLGRFWLLRGALLGDAQCLLAVSFDALSPYKAWAYATLAKERGDERIQAMAAWLQRRVEAHASPEEMEQAREFLHVFRGKMQGTANVPLWVKEWHFEEMIHTLDRLEEEIKTYFAREDWAEMQKIHNKLNWLRLQPLLP